MKAQSPNVVHAIDAKCSQRCIEFRANNTPCITLSMKEYKKLFIAGIEREYLFNHADDGDHNKNLVTMAYMSGDLESPK